MSLKPDAQNFLDTRTRRTLDSIPGFTGAGATIGGAIGDGPGAIIGAAIGAIVGIFADIFGGGSGVSQKKFNQLAGLTQSIWKHLVSLAAFTTSLEDLVGLIVSGLQDLVKHLSAIVSTIWNALKKLGLSRIYHWIQELFGLFKRVQDWVQKYILGPLRAYQKMLLELYDKYFLPVIKLFNDLERLTQIIGIFDKKLAAQIDQFLWNLELKITAPILRAMQRVNVISTYIEAILTLNGYFDRLTQLSSIWRDAGLIRSILHNPYQQKVTPGAPAPEIPLNVQAAPFVQYLKTGTGDYAADIETGVLNVRQYLAELQANG